MSDVKCKSDVEGLQIGDLKIIERNDEIFVFDATDNLLIRFPRNNRGWHEWRDFVFYTLIYLQTVLLCKVGYEHSFKAFYDEIYGSKHLDSLFCKVVDIQDKECKNKKAAL